jgi:amidase
MGATASSVALMSLSFKPAFAGFKKNSDDFVKLDALAQAELVRKKEVSPTELIEAAIARIEKTNPEINAITHKSFDMAREKAKNFTGGGGVFAGVPYVFKGLSQYKGLPATRSSRFLATNIAKTQTAYEDTLDKSGAILMGISNTPEFGLLATTESSLYGAAKNPWDLTRSTAGSSGGTGAAVAAGMVPIGTASDGGGSIRMPAAHCGLLGLKPSRGRSIGMNGSFLDNRGCISRSVRDTAAYMAITENQKPVGMPKIGMVSTPLKKRLKVAMTTKGHFNNAPHPHVAEATLGTAKLLAGLGHEVVETRFDITGDEFMHHFMTLWSLGAYHMTVLAREKFGKEPDESSFEPWTLGLARMHKEERDYMSVEAAYTYFRVMHHNYERFMQEFDVYLTPVLDQPPIKLGMQSPDVDYDLLMERILPYVSYTPLANATGAPSISVPLHWSKEHLPVGSLFTSGFGKEALLLQLAYELEKAQPWADKWAPYSAAHM